MPASTRRSNPHLRLTAAILVAMLAALAGALDTDKNNASLARARRSEAHSALSALGIVSVPLGTPARDGLVAAIRAAHIEIVASSGSANLASGTADARAERRSRLDASRASRACALRTTALPPPVA